MFYVTITTVIISLFRFRGTKRTFNFRLRNTENNREQTHKEQIEISSETHKWNKKLCVCLCVLLCVCVYLCVLLYVTLCACVWRYPQ